MMHNRGFGSDNFSGVLPEVLAAINSGAAGHHPSYGEDLYTQKAIDDFKQIFGNNIEVYFVYNGTGANIISLSAFCRPYHAVICTETAHINVDECGAVQKQIGCSLLTTSSADGKLTIEMIKKHLSGLGDQHHSQPYMISISQCTELGTVYTPEELKTICDFAHANGMCVHMDGARIANAIAFLGCSPQDITTKAGVDVLSFGGTKNGMMFGEAVVFFNTSVCKDVKYIRKQDMQLHSKSRFIAMQFSAVLKEGLWLKTAAHANRMARLLSEQANCIPGIQIMHKVEGNEVFAIIPKTKVSRLQEQYFFYVWDEEKSAVRWVCSFDTEESDVSAFIALLKKELQEE